MHTVLAASEGVVTGNAGAADICFLIAFVLAGVAALLVGIGKEGWSLLVALALCAGFIGLFVA